MKIFRTASLLILSALLFSSCQKELSFAEDAQNNPAGPGGGPGSGDVNVSGTWRFVGMVAQTGSRTEFTESGSTTRMEAILNYTASNPAGTISFNNGVMNVNGMAYDMQGNSVSKIWMDGILLTDMTTPSTGTVPPTTSTGEYTMVGSDSLTFEEAPIFSPTSPNIPVGSTVNMGARFRMSNDTMYMRVRFNDPIPFPDPSIPGTMQIFGDIEMALKK